MDRRNLRYAAFGTAVVFGTQIAEEALEPHEASMPHAETEDFTPSVHGEPFPWVASGNSMASNSFVVNGFTFKGPMRGPFDDV